MSNSNNKYENIEDLESKIKQAEQNNKPIDKYVKKEIIWLEQQLQNFLQIMKEKGRTIETDFDIAEIEIRQYTMMKELAQKINMPTNIYDEKIKSIQCRIFGEENWENFFGN